MTSPSTHSATSPSTNSGTTGTLSSESFGLRTMSLGSSSSSHQGPFHFAHLITVRLNAENYLFWRQQVVPLLRSHMLMGFVTGELPCPAEEIPNPSAEDAGAPRTIRNPAHQAWMQQDQAILSAIVSSLTEGVQGMVLLVVTSREAWETLATSFSSASAARSMQLRFQLSTVKKQDLSAAQYFHKVKALSDTLTSIGKPLQPEEFISYLLAGLDSEYDAMVEVITARTEAMPIRDVFAQLLSTEQRLEGRRAEFNPNIHSANLSFNNRSGGRPQRSDDRGYGRQGGVPIGNIFSSHTPPSSTPSNAAPRPGGNTGGNGNGNRPVCQLCGKIGHIASKCFKRFKREFAGIGNEGRGGGERQAAAATQGQTPSYPVDPSWYVDTGATDHLTNDLDKLAVKEPYLGKDQVHTANGTGSGYEGNSA